MFNLRCKKKGKEEIKQCNCGLSSLLCTVKMKQKYRYQWAVHSVFYSLSIRPLEGLLPQGDNSESCVVLGFNPQSRIYGWWIVSPSGLDSKCAMGNRAGEVRIQTPIQKGRRVSAQWSLVQSTRTVFYSLWIVFSEGSSLSVILWSFTQQTERLFPICQPQAIPLTTTEHWKYALLEATWLWNSLPVVQFYHVNSLIVKGLFRLGYEFSSITSPQKLSRILTCASLGSLCK